MLQDCLNFTILYFSLPFFRASTVFNRRTMTNQHLSLFNSQGEESVDFKSTFEQRLRSLELHHAESETLLHVHAALLHELQVQLRNLSATVQLMSHNASCTVNVIRTTPLLSMRDTLPPGTHATSTVVSCVNCMQPYCHAIKTTHSSTSSQLYSFYFTTL